MPVTVHGRLTALVALGRKSQQELFRPDEMAPLTRTGGFDIEALRGGASARYRAALYERAEREEFVLGQLGRAS